jgi:uncharacterized membrane protein YjjP (DUF1212 family)
VRERDYFQPRLPEEVVPSPALDGATLDGSDPVEFHGEVFVDPDETAGLPGPPPDGAVVLVRAHTHRRRVFPSLAKLRLPKTSARATRRSEKAQTEVERAGSSDVERSAGYRSGPRGSGVAGGVLSALLALYDHDDPDDSLSSAATSGYSTPASVRSLSRDRRGRSGERRGARSMSPSQIESESVTLAAVTGAHSPIPKSPSSTKRFSLPDVGKALGFDSRPAVERNGAGVFGSLIATTGNITGAAAPAPSTIAPNLKRPGYHISRYSYEEVPPPRVLHRSQSMRSLAHAKQTPSESGSTSLVDSPSGMTPADKFERIPTTTSGAPLFISPLNSAAPAVGAGDGPSYRSKWSEVLSLPKRGMQYSSSAATTPGESIRTTGTINTDDGSFLDEKSRTVPRMGREKDARDEQRRERRRRKKKQEVFIIRHIEDLLARQTFVLKLARAMMMFGGPTHRLQAQMQSTARVLEISLSCMYLPDTMLMAFDDEVTSTSSVKLIKQGSALDLTKLTYAYKIYWAVIHDEMSVSEASNTLDELMCSKSTYRAPALIFFGGMASASICSVSFHGSLVDSLISFPLGCILVAVQIFSARNELYSNVFECVFRTSCHALTHC